MSKSSRLLIVLVAAAFVLQVTALGQESTKPWSLSAGVRERWTDNRDGVKSDKEDNLDSILELRADFHYRLEQTVFDLFYMPTPVWRSNPRDDQKDYSIFHSVGAAVDHSFSARSRVYAVEMFDYTDDPRATLGDGSVREKASYYLNRLNGGVDYGFSPNGTLGLDGRYSVKRYDKKIWADNSDEDRAGAGLTCKYALSPDMSVLAKAGYNWASFEGPRNGAGIQTYGVGLDKKFSAMLSANVLAGVDYATLDNAADDSESAPMASGEVVVSPSPTSRLRLGAGYMLEQSDVDPFALQARTVVSAKLEHELTAKLAASLMALYQNGSYDKGYVTDGNTGADGDDALQFGSVGLAYKIDRTWTVGASYDLEHWDSDLREDFTRNTVSGFVRATL